MFMLRLPVNSWLSVVKFLRSQKLHVDFGLCGGSVPLTYLLFKVQLYKSKCCTYFSFPAKFFGSSFVG